jgi:tetratricopeptide (TPR) repeat protein
MCIFLVILFILSGVALYLRAYFKSENAEQADSGPDVLIDSGSDSVAADSSGLPPIPELPEHMDAEMPIASAKDDPFANDFDGLAHLQLMRKNSKEYNYQMAYRHGVRIIGYLTDNPELAAEWGHILLEAGKPQDAVSVLQKLDSKSSIKSDVVIDLAFAMHRSGETESAIQLLDDKLKGKSDVDLLATKAAIVGEHPDTNRRVAAEAIFKSTLRKDASLPNVNYWYSRYLMNRGDYQSSKNHVELALKAKPNDPRYITRLGMAEFYLKNDSKAEELYRIALKINPYDYNAWFSLGELYLSKANESSHVQDVRKNTRKALESYLKSIEYDSLHTKAHYRIGLILNGNGGYKEAIRHLMVAMEKMPNDIPIMQQMSVAYLQIGDTANSIGYLDKILQLDPFNKIAATQMRRIKGDI